MDGDWLKHLLKPLGISRLVVKEGGPVAMRGVGEWVRGLYTLGSLMAEASMYDN